jgi:hypothetical protein
MTQHIGWQFMICRFCHEALLLHATLQAKIRHFHWLQSCCMISWGLISSSYFAVSSIITSPFDADDI